MARGEGGHGPAQVARDVRARTVAPAPQVGERRERPGARVPVGDSGPLGAGELHEAHHPREGLGVALRGERLRARHAGPQAEHAALGGLRELRLGRRDRGLGPLKECHLQEELAALGDGGLQGVLDHALQALGDPVEPVREPELLAVHGLLEAEEAVHHGGGQVAECAAVGALLGGVQRLGLVTPLPQGAHQLARGPAVPPQLRERRRGLRGRRLGGQRAPQHGAAQGRGPQRLPRLPGAESPRGPRKRGDLLDVGPAAL